MVANERWSLTRDGRKGKFDCISRFATEKLELEKKKTVEGDISPRESYRHLLFRSCRVVFFFFFFDNKAMCILFELLKG